MRSSNRFKHKRLSENWTVGRWTCLGGIRTYWPVRTLTKALRCLHITSSSSVLYVSFFLFQCSFFNDEIPNYYFFLLSFQINQIVGVYWSHVVEKQKPYVVFLVFQKPNYQQRGVSDMWSVCPYCKSFGTRYFYFLYFFFFMEYKYITSNHKKREFVIFRTFWETIFQINEIECFFLLDNWDKNVNQLNIM